MMTTLRCVCIRLEDGQIGVRFNVHANIHQHRRIHVCLQLVERRHEAVSKNFIEFQVLGASLARIAQSKLFEREDCAACNNFFEVPSSYSSYLLIRDGSIYDIFLE